MERKVIDYKVLEKDGMRFRFDVQAERSSIWECGNRSVPQSPLESGRFGTSQNFISYDFYQNLIK